MGENKMTMWIILPTINPDYLNLIHWTNMVQGEKCLIQVVY